MTKESMFNKIKEYATAYYTGNALISDDEFDALVEEYESQYGKLDKVGWGFIPSGKKVPHKYGLVGSLTKTRDATSIDFRDKIITDKLDGISCVAYYEKGELVRALTRGTGTEGVDITDKYVMIPGAVTSVKEYCNIKFTGAVRGEILMTKSMWDLFSNRYSDEGYKNSRNAVAGIMGSKDYDEKKFAYFNFVTYKIVGWEDHPADLTSYVYILESLKKFGFDTVRYINTDSLTVLPRDNDDMKYYYEVEKVDYPRDGFVITQNNVKINREVIYQDFAFKFKSDVKTTTVVGIDWNLTRTGKMIPTVLVDPVELAGVTVRRATGYNAQFIRDYNIAKGKKIQITRSGEVIPCITAVLQEYEDGTDEWEFIYELYKEESDD